MTRDFDLLCGDWKDVLDVYVDHLISDHPFGARTHAGWNAGSMAAINGLPHELNYDCWTEADVFEYVEFWSPRVRGWMVDMTSHDLIPAWEAAYKKYDRLGRYVFSPLPIYPPMPYVDFGKCPRITGDGHASWTCYVMAARPRERSWLKDWQRRRKELGLSRSLDGAYKREEGDVIWAPPAGRKRIGGKPLGVMKRIVEDHSFVGDRVLDTHAGHGTTLRACLELGRYPIGCEIDHEVWEDAMMRLRQPLPLQLFGRVESPREQLQLELLQ